jgi:WS/DGAT/MGAT family acyltransferase
MAKRERISSVDTAWLRMDRPTNLMMIVGVMIFDTPLDFDRLKRTIECRLLPYRRFRQRAVQEVAGAWWEDDESFDIDAHLHRAVLPGKGSKAELQQYAAELIATQLDHGRPLWSFHLIERYAGGSALVVRIHHSIADGIALIGVMNSLTSNSPDAPEPAVPEASAFDNEDNPWRQIFEPVTHAMVSTINLSASVWLKYFDLVLNPGQVVTYGKHGVGIANELATLLLMPVDSPTRFKGQPGGAKCVAWSEPMPLNEIKAVGKALGCSVNDVLLSSVAGALRAYLLEKGDAVDGVELRALVPINMRSKEDEGKLGNRFGMVTLLLPVGESNPLARVFEVRRRMGELKGSYQPVVSLGILGAVGLAPKLVQDQVLDMLAAKATAVMTNVPGPTAQRYVAGARLAQQMFWVPQSGDIGMGVSILSYNGNVQFGLVIDKRFAPDPERIVSRFEPEFEKLLYSVLLEPWDELRDPGTIEQSLEQELEIKTCGNTAAKPRKPRAPKKTRAARVPAAKTPQSGPEAG